MSVVPEAHNQPASTFPHGKPQPVGFYAWYILAIMVIVLAVSLIDRQILSILAEDVKRDLDLTDAQLGFLYGTAFAIFYTLAGIPLGRLADSWWRTRLMAIGLILWSLMTIASGFASSLAFLAIARIGVGAGEACASPVAYSILADTFPKERRALAISIFTIGGSAGIGLSLPVGGFLSDSWNNAFPPGQAPLGLEGWQAAFIGVGAPGLLLALWVLSLREPKRKDPKGYPLPIVRPGALRRFLIDVLAILPPFNIVLAAKQPGGLARNLISAAVVVVTMALLIWLTGDYGQWIAFGIGVHAFASWIQSLRTTDPVAYDLIWNRRAVMLCTFAAGLTAVTINAVALWSAPHAMRSFGVTASEIGPMIGIPAAIAAALGSVASGFLSDGLKRRDPRGRGWVCALAAAVPIPLVFFAFTRQDLSSFVLIVPFIYFFASFLTASAVAMLQDFVIPRMYATVGALFLFSCNIGGLALGPYVSGKIATVTGSLPIGVMMVMVAPVAAFFIFWGLGRFSAEAEARKLEWARAAGEPISTE
jgi:MFS family permease